MTAQELAQDFRQFPGNTITISQAVAVSGLSRNAMYKLWHSVDFRQMLIKPRKGMSRELRMYKTDYCRLMATE